jgi:hypothetical protein
MQRYRLYLDLLMISEELAVRSPVGGSILVEVDNIPAAEGGNILPVVDIRHIPGEAVVANHNLHIHPVEEDSFPAEEEYRIACLTIYQAISLRIHDYPTTTVADHTHRRK